MNQVEYQTVVLAGLLYGIGEFLQKARQMAPNHALVGKDLSQFDMVRLGIDNDLLTALMQHRYEVQAGDQIQRSGNGMSSQARILALLLKRADDLSRGGRPQEDSCQHRQGERECFVPLASVFDQIALLKKDTPSVQHGYRLSPLWASGEAVFPQKDLTELNPGEVSRQASGFENEYARLVKQAQSFESLLTGAMTLLEQYAWAMPSDVNQPDVSLADHLRTTVAIAACLYRYHVETGTLDKTNILEGHETRFRLLVGDLSGIQTYLFDIATVGEEGVGRRLRARSLFVQLLGEVGACLALECFQLPPTNVLMASGGSFYVLWPNLPEAEDKVEALHEQTDQWLMEHLNGEIALNLISVPFNDDGFQVGGNERGFGAVLERAHTALGKQKRRRFQTYFQHDGRWDDASFLLKVDLTEGACRSCGKFPIEFDGLCEYCQYDTEVGGLLPWAEMLAFYNDENGPVLGKTEQVLGKTVQVLVKDETPLGNPFLVATLGKLHISGQYPTACWPPAPYAPDLRFEPMAARSKGANLLGYLKADVDWLGQILAHGLKRDNGHNLDTPSRLITLSRQLERFFNAWLPGFLQEEKFSNCYTVFAGGDDLFIIGPWSDMVHLAGEIQKRFTRFVCDHPEITLSAGIVLVKPKYPLARASDFVNETLKQAKQERNRIALLGDVLKWNEYDAVLREWRKLVEGQPRSAFLYSLLQYGEMWRDYREQGDTRGLRYLPLLANNVARNVPSRQRGLRQWAERLIRLSPDEETRQVLDHLALIASLAILSRRAKED